MSETSPPYTNLIEQFENAGSIEAWFDAGEWCYSDFKDILAALRVAERVRKMCESRIVIDNRLLDRHASDSLADIQTRSIVSSRLQFAEQMLNLANEAGECDG